MDGVIFTKRVTYNRRAQFEAVVGEWPDERRVVLRQSARDRMLWDVETPTYSAAYLSGPTVRRGGEVLARALGTREAKAFAAAYLAESAEVGERRSSASVRA